MRLAAKTDLNQQPLVKSLRQVPGITVHSTAALGKGFPDLCVGYKGRNYLFEVKNPDMPPSKQRLSDDEENWHSQWTGHVAIITTVDQALAHMGIIR